MCSTRLLSGHQQLDLGTDHSVLDGVGQGGVEAPSCLSHERCPPVVGHGGAPDTPRPGGLLAVDDNRVDCESQA
eukprot:3359973-Rhodomonas_salina.1